MRNSFPPNADCTVAELLAAFPKHSMGWCGTGDKVRAWE